MLTLFTLIIYYIVGYGPPPDLGVILLVSFFDLVNVSTGALLMHFHRKKRIEKAWKLGYRHYLRLHVEKIKNRDEAYGLYWGIPTSEAIKSDKDLKELL